MMRSKNAALNLWIKMTQRTIAVRKLVLAGMILLLTGCSLFEATPTPSITPTFTPTSCAGWWCSITGVIYEERAIAGNELQDAVITLNQTSWCSPTSGQHSTVTDPDGKFKFNEVFLHDTDTLQIQVESEGFESAQWVTGGFECLNCSCFQSPLELVLQPAPVGNELAQSWQDDIDQIKKLFKSQSIPKHLQNEQPVMTGEEFDLMQVFEFLDHISMAPGNKLAYSYFYQSSFAGSPTIYVCNEDFVGTPTGSDCEKNFMSFVITDGSQQGYLQWILLNGMADHFYLYWHANAKDYSFIATDNALNDILAEISGSFNLQQKLQAKLIDPKPQVRIGDDNVDIRVVWYSQFEGFIETRYQLKKDFPHTIQGMKFNKLLDYNSGIIY